MRVVHVSYSVDGGAGKAALRLHQNLRALGADSWILAFDQGNTLPPSLHPGLLDKFLARYMKNIDKLPNKLRRRRVTASWSNNWAPNLILRRIRELKPDVLHLHFIGAGTFPIRDFELVQCPIVWTLHDMLAFTGGCHYTGGCERFLDQCGNCPTLHSSSPDDLSRTNWMRKKKSWKNLRLTLVSPSKWLATEAHRSSLMANQNVMVIPYGIDLDCFRPANKLAARKELGISDDKFVIAFGAARLTDPRKGLDLLWEALKDFDSRQTMGRRGELLVFGAGGWNAPGSSIPICNVGLIDDDRRLALLYSAADVFCAPSREENLANTALESLACGTPVLAFEIGGFPDIIDHQRTGYLATPFEARSLADGLEYLCSSHVAGEDFRAACRARAESLYNGRTNANHYMELYKNLIASKADSPFVSLP